MTGIDGERGQQGDPGTAGATGPRGARGDSGKGLTRWQTLSLFAIITGSFSLLGWHHEQQQADIEVNTARIAAIQMLTCENGRRILDGFNHQQDKLADIERQLLRNPTASPAGREAAAARIEAYEGGKIVPLPTCPPR